jgi:hypothetical protein
MNINHSLINSSVADPGSQRLSNRIDNSKLIIVIEEIIEHKLAQNPSTRDPNSQIISSGHPGFGSTFKISGVT